MTNKVLIIGDQFSTNFIATVLRNRITGLDLTGVICAPAPQRIEAPLTNIDKFTALLGIQWQRLVSQGAVELCLAHRFSSAKLTCASATDYFALADYGAAHFIPFEQHYQKVRATGDDSPFSSYCLAASAAALGKFQLPIAADRQNQQRFDASVKFDLDALSPLLNGACDRTVSLIESGLEIGATARHCSLQGLAHPLEFDLVLIAEPALMPDANHTEAPAWIPKFNRDSGYTASDSIDALTTLTAVEHGFVKQVQTRKQLQREVLTLAPGERAQLPKSFWQRDIVFLGAAAIELPHLLGSYTDQLIQELDALLKYWPYTAFDPISERYNQQVRDWYVRYLELQYLVGVSLSESPGWTRNCEVHERLQLFNQQGYWETKEGDILGKNDMIHLLLCLGNLPQQQHPIAAGYPLELSIDLCKSLRMAISQQVATLPPTADFYRWVERSTSISG